MKFVRIQCAGFDFRTKEPRNWFYVVSEDKAANIIERILGQWSDLKVEIIGISQPKQLWKTETKEASAMSKVLPIEGKKIAAYSVDPQYLTIIGIDTNDGNEHPLFDSRIHLPLDESLVRNIMVHGVLENVITQKDGVRLLVVAGRQRVRAAREANRRLSAEGSITLEVPISIRRGDEAAILGVMISENEGRAEDSLESRLVKLKKLLDYGKSVEECAAFFCVGSQTIKNWIGLIEAGTELKEALKKGLLSASAGSQIASLPRSEQAAAVQEATANGKASTAIVQGVVRSKKRAKKDPGNPDAGGPAIVAPGKRVLKKLVENEQFGEFAKEVRSDHERFVKFIMWILGETRSDRIKGLNAILGSLE